MSDEYDCDTCDRVFATWSASVQHMDALHHWEDNFECDKCDLTFNTYSAVEQHMDALNHRKGYIKCETCSCTFRSQASCDQHMDTLDHWGPDSEDSDDDSEEDSDDDGEEDSNDTNTSVNVRSQSTIETNNLSIKTTTGYGSFSISLPDGNHMYCRDCNRHCNGADAMRTHLNLPVHRAAGSRNVACPFCRRNFAALSSLSMHLESSSCPNARHLNRAAVHRIVRENDTTGNITNEKSLEEEQASGLDATAIATTNPQWNPQLAWCGNGYECYICHCIFATPQGLEHHVGSEAHHLPLYHCPNVQGNCGRHFTSLGALFDHLESEVCGYKRFAALQKGVQTGIRNVIAWREQNLTAPG